MGPRGGQVTGVVWGGPGGASSSTYLDIFIVVIICTPISIDCTDLATYSYLDL
jgi:hypothetical protein